MFHNATHPVGWHCRLRRYCPPMNHGLWVLPPSFLRNFLFPVFSSCHRKWMDSTLPGRGLGRRHRDSLNGHGNNYAQSILADGEKKPTVQKEGVTKKEEQQHHHHQVLPVFLLHGRPWQLCPFRLPRVPCHSRPKNTCLVLGSPE